MALQYAAIYVSPIPSNADRITAGEICGNHEAHLRKVINGAFFLFQEIILPFDNIRFRFSAVNAQTYMYSATKKVTGMFTT